MEFHHIVPHDGDVDGEMEKNEDNPASPDPPIWSEVVVVLSFAFFWFLYLAYQYSVHF